jgi:hypothetical protein
MWIAGAGTQECVRALPVSSGRRRVMIVAAIIGSALLIVIVGAVGFLASDLHIQG